MNRRILILAGIALAFGRARPAAGAALRADPLLGRDAAGAGPT